MKKIKIIVANPSGNITIFVLTPCERKDYQTIGASLLAHKELKGEQVGFIKSLGKENILEMAGMEFCGNAGRAFALYSAREQGLKEPCTIRIKETGTTQLLSAQVDPVTGYTKIKMPLPLKVGYWEQRNTDLEEQPIKVDLGGIVHVVLLNQEPSQEIFEEIKETIYAKEQPAAMGVVFLKEATSELVPVVYARGINTTYWEGSCGSGSQAAAVALAWYDGHSEGTFCYTFHQPAGTIKACVEKAWGKITECYIEGPIELGPVQEIEV